MTPTVVRSKAPPRKRATAPSPLREVAAGPASYERARPDHAAGAAESPRGAHPDGRPGGGSEASPST